MYLELYQRSFFWRIEDTIVVFRDCLTFKMHRIVSFVRFLEKLRRPLIAFDISSPILTLVDILPIISS